MANTISLPDWVLSLGTTPSSLIAATSKGTLHQLPLDPLKWSSISTTTLTPQHKSTIHKLVIDPLDTNTAYTASEDSTVKVWDLRQPLTVPQHTLQNSRSLPFFSIDVNHGKLAAGSQLKGVDSELILFDLRNLTSPLRSFIDSHNDDITITKFNPIKRNILLSGATDGYVNVYDIDVVDEDDAMVQCITFESVHSAHWLTESRISVLSHIETFGVFNMSQESDLIGESTTTATTTKADVLFGDVREKWDCEYVVDVYAPGYVVCGKNSVSELTVREFNTSTEVVGDVVWKGDGWHDGEVVRDWCCRDGVAYSGGEDGKVWASVCDLGDTKSEFVDCKVEVDDDFDEADGIVVEFEKKEKKRGKKERKKEKKHRFKPY